jgi:hypothetical protein
VLKFENLTIESGKILQSKSRALKFKN